MAKKTERLDLRMEAAWCERLTEYCIEHGISRSEAIRQAVDKYCKPTETAETPP